MILAPTNRRVIRPYDKPSFEHTQRYGLIRGHWANTNRVGLWLFNEGSGKKVLDLSGYNNTGTFGAGAASPIWVPGEFGPSLSFDGGDYIEINDTYYDSGTHPQMTVSIWVYSTGFVLNEMPMARYNFKPFAIQITSISGSDANFKTSVQTDGTGYIQPTTTGYPLTANKWHNIVSRYNGVTCKAFLDGKEVATASGTGNLLTDASSNIYIGSYSKTQYHFTGKFDLPMIYKLALSFSEIALLYREPFLGIQREPRISYFFVPTVVGEDYFRTIDDGIGIVDDMGRTQVQTRTITDGIGTVDDMGRTQVQTRTLAESLGITDALWKAETRIFADAVGITDAVIKSQGYARSIADDIGLVDSESKLITYVRTLAEAMGMTDAMSKIVGFPRTISDDVGITDSVTRTATFARITAEAMGMTDVVTRTQVQLRTIADAMGLTDVMAPGQLVTFAEAMGITDAMEHTKTQIRTIADDLGITDELTRIATYVFTQADDVGIGDAMIRVAIALRTISDDVGMTDEMSGQIGELVKAAWAFMIIRQTHN